MTMLLTTPQPSSPLYPSPLIQRVRPAVSRRKRVSEAEYWAKYYHDADHCYEWNNGYLEEKPMPDRVSYFMYDWLVKLLGHYLEVHPIAETIGLEMGFRLVLPRQTVVRKPDLGIVRYDNPIPLGDYDPSYQGIFDICIESLSYSKPSEVKRDTVTKKREYAKAGVPEYYILDSRGKNTAFYHLTTRGVYALIPPVAGTDLICSSVLPGFQFRMADLSRRPSVRQMSQDSVYQGFVGLDLQAERRKVATAEPRAAAAEAKLQQLEAELARLRRPNFLAV